MQRVAAHLWTHAPCPPEYLELVLCRDVYHCTPVELARVPLDTVLNHLAAMRAEQLVNERKNGKRTSHH